MAFAVLGTVFLFAAPLAAAQDKGAENDPVVARVNGEEIRQSAVFALASSLPPQFQSQIVQVYPLLVQRLVDFKLAGAAGREAGLADDPEVKVRLAEAADRVIRDTYLERAINARIDDEGLRARYDAFVAATPPVSEQRARHILLKSEEKAREVIEKLDGGADFVELAKEFSTGPSGPQGGDLGYFREGQMVPEFAEATSALQPGEHSKDPIKTQFGWHVIKLEDRRDAPQPSFEETEPRLREEMSREAVEAVLGDLCKNAKVEITDAGKSFAPPADAAQ